MTVPPALPDQSAHGPVCGCYGYRGAGGLLKCRPGPRPGPDNKNFLPEMEFRMSSFLRHFSGEPQNTLNYNIRVLVLNAVAGMDQLASIRPDLDAMVTVADFTPGHRYADFQEGSDRSAEYGLAALVAGGVAAKAGWLAPLLLFAKRFLVLILVGLGWLGQRLFKVFRKEA